MNRILNQLLNENNSNMHAKLRQASHDSRCHVFEYPGCQRFSRSPAARSVKSETEPNFLRVKAKETLDTATKSDLLTLANQTYTSNLGD